MAKSIFWHVSGWAGFGYFGLWNKNCQKHGAFSLKTTQLFHYRKAYKI